MFETSTVGTIITGFVNDLSSLLASNLPGIFSVFIALTGLGILLHYVRKFIGRRA